MEVGARARSAALRPPATVPRCAARRAAPFAAPGVRCGPLRRKPLPPPAAAELLQGSSPLVGFERLAAAAPPPLRQALLLHSFVLLDAGGEVCAELHVSASQVLPSRRLPSLNAPAYHSIAPTQLMRKHPPAQTHSGVAVRLPASRTHGTAHSSNAPHRRHRARRRARAAAAGSRAQAPPTRRCGQVRAHFSTQTGCSLTLCCTLSVHAQHASPCTLRSLCRAGCRNNLHPPCMRPITPGASRACRAATRPRPPPRSPLPGALTFRSPAATAATTRQRS